MRRERPGVTFVEILIVISLASLVSAICFPMVTRMLRTSLQVRERSGLQTSMRIGLEYMVRDIHKSHSVLAATSGALDLFVPDAAVMETPEAVVGANRAATGGLPHFPLSAASTAPADGSRTQLPGQLVSYRFDRDKATLERATRKGHLSGTVAFEESTRRTYVSTVEFTPGGEAETGTVAREISAFLTVPFGYGPSGHLRRAPEPGAAAGVVVRIEGRVTPEGDKPEKPVVETALAKAWLMRRLSEAVHPGTATAWDDALDY